MVNLTPAQRLIVAADFTPPLDSCEWVHGTDAWVQHSVLGLADELHGTGIVLKVNSALRVCGYGLIRQIRLRGLEVFADLKLADIPDTVATDATILNAEEYRPQIVTAFAASGSRSLAEVKKNLPYSEVLGVTALTHLKEDEVLQLYGETSTLSATLKLAGQARQVGLGIVCAPAEAEFVRERYSGDYSIIAAGVRPEWARVANESQNLKRVMTPSEAIKAGVTRVVMGRPILQASNRRDAVLRTIDELTGVSLVA